MAVEAPRCGVVWSSRTRPPYVPMRERPSFFFFFFFPTREGGGRRIGFCERGERRGGRASGAPARGFWTRNTRPRTATHGAPSNQKPPHPPRWACLHACTGKRTIPTHPGPSPFRSGRVDLCLFLHVLFVLTFFSVSETQPTNTSSFFSHNNRDQGTKKGKSGKSFTTQRKDEPRVRLPVQAAADRRQRRGKVVPPAALR